MEDKNLKFLNELTPRVGPQNAMNLMKDAKISALTEIVENLTSKEEVEKVANKHLKKIAQNILNMPVRSLIQQKRGS